MIEDQAGEDPVEFDPVEDVSYFHIKFGLRYDGPPRSLDPDLEALRMLQMAEETAEMCEAATPADRLDACVDKIYFILGYCYLKGWDFREAWHRVHIANMLKVRAKEDGSNSKRNSGYDVVKPPGWTHPDLSDLVEKSEVVNFDWNTAKDDVKHLLGEVSMRDTAPPQYVGLGSLIRLRFKPILERLNKNERTLALFNEIQKLKEEFHVK